MSLDVEKKMKLLRFQYRVNELENNRFEVLDHDEFVKELGDYLLRLYQLDHREVATRVIEKVGECTCHRNMLQRERAQFVLLHFAEKVGKKGGVNFFNIVSSYLESGKNVP